MQWIVNLVTAWWQRRRQRRRELLRIFDGRRWKYVDPFVCYRRLWNHPQLNLEAQAPLVDIGQEPETTTVVAALAEIFGVERWDPATQSGLTDWQILEIFDRLNHYMLGLKKNTSTSPISSPATGSEFSSSTEPQPETTSA